MRNYYEIKTAKNQEITIEALEILSGYFRYKYLELTFYPVEDETKQALEKIASNYEADFLATQKQAKVILSIEREDNQEEWLETITEELDQELIKEKPAQTLGQTLTIEETDETIKTLQIVTAQDLNATDFNRKQELTQRDEITSNLGLAIEDYLRVNQKLARDQQPVNINQELTNTKETIRLHYPKITGHNSEYVALIEREYKITAPITDVSKPYTETKKPNNQGAVGSFYTVDGHLIEVITFEDVQRRTSTDFDQIIESMELYSTPDFKAFYEEQWSHYPIITRERNKTAEQFVALAKEAINEKLAYTSNMTTYNREDLGQTTISHTYTEKMNPNTYVFLVIREIKN